MATRVLLAGVLAFGVASCGGERNAVTTAPETAQLEAASAGSQRSAGKLFESERQWGPIGRDDWEPVNAADPSSTWVYQITTAQKPNFLEFRASSDGGRRWGNPRHLCRRGIKLHFQFDPQVVVAPDGTVDVVCLDNYLPGVVFAQSRDHGHTWSAPVRLDGTMRYSDKPTLVVSPSGRDVYVAFNVDYALYVASSHDAGATWNAAVKATTRRLWYYPYSGAVAPDGSVSFAVDGETGKNQTGPGYIAIVRSGDGGTAWSTIPMAATHVGAACLSKNCYPDFFTGQAAIAIDRAGAYAFAYAQNRITRGPNALFVRRSADGVGWSDPVAVAVAGNSTSPALAAGSGAGDFRLVWQDDRNGARAWNTWYARSVDGGATWSSNVRLSDLGSGAPYKNAAGYDFPFGDYLGLSVDSAGVNHVIWGEGDGVYVPGGTWWTFGG